MKCPNCGAHLQSCGPRGLEENQCPQCGGSWLSKRCVEWLRRRLMVPPESGEPPPDGTGRFAQIVPLLIDSLSAEDRLDRHRAVTAIAAIGPDAKAAVPVLQALLGKDYWLQESVALALGAIGPDAEPAVDALGAVALQRGAPNWAHIQAARSLGRIGSARAVPYLMEAARNPSDQGPGIWAMGALGSLGRLARDAVPMLTELLRDGRFNRHAIVDTLRHIGPADGLACQTIVRILKGTRSKELRRAAATALYHVLFTGGNPPRDVAALFAVLQKDRCREIRRTASAALDHLRREGRL